MISQRINSEGVFSTSHDGWHRMVISYNHIFINIILTSHYYSIWMIISLLSLLSYILINGVCIYIYNHIIIIPLFISPTKPYHYPYYPIIYISYLAVALSARAPLPDCWPPPKCLDAPVPRCDPSPADSSGTTAVPRCGVPGWSSLPPGCGWKPRCRDGPFLVFFLWKKTFGNTSKVSQSMS